MADTKISALSAVTASAMTDEFPINQSGTTKKITKHQIVGAVSSGLIPLQSPKYVRAYASSASGDNVVYTCPSGKRAYVNAFNVYNTTGSTINFYPTFYTGSAHVKLSTTLGASANASNQVATSVQICLDAGEGYGVNAAATGLNIFVRVVEFDASTPLFSVKKFGSWSSGDNTIYTVPASTSAILVDGVGMVAQNVTSLNYYNSSGGSRTIIWYWVPSGGSTGSTNQVSASTTVANDAKSNAIQSSTFSTGDFIVLNTNSTADTQFAWITLMELPA